MNWINVKERLPQHQQRVLAQAKSGRCYVEFCDSIKMNEELVKNGYANECVNTSIHPYYFCSTTHKGHTLNNVTHWLPVPELAGYEP